MMFRDAPGAPGPLVVAVGAALVVVVAALPVVGSSSQGLPVLLEVTGDEGDSWAVAIRSHDEPTSAKGNELEVRVRADGSYTASAASTGVMDIRPDGEQEWALRSGVVAGTFQQENRMGVAPVGDLPAPQVTWFEGNGPLLPGNGPVLAMKEHRWLDPGEWRYIVAWVAGSEMSTFKVKGEGIEVEGLVEGEAYALGNSELIQGGGLHVRQGVTLPQALARGPANLGTGVTQVENTGATLESSTSLLGVFTAFKERLVCGPEEVRCTSATSVTHQAIGTVRDGDAADLSVASPAQGNVSNPWDLYWLTPQESGSAWMDGSVPGTYEFSVDRFMDVSGPTYRDPETGTGARMTGEELLLSLAEVPYAELGGVETG